MNPRQVLRVAIGGETKTVQDPDGSYVQKYFLNEIDAQFSQLLAEALGQTLELHTPEDKERGRLLPDGNWTGLIGMVVRGEADIGLSKLAITEERSQAVNFSYPFTSIGMTFVTLNPEYQADVASFLKPFSYQVWIALVASFFAVALAFYGLSHRKHDLAKLLFYVYGVFLGQEISVRLRKSAEHVLAAHWLVAMTVLCCCYQALLLSFLTFPPLHGVRTIAELAAAIQSGRYQCSTYPGSYLTPSLEGSSDQAARTIGQNLRTHPGTTNFLAFLGDQTTGKRPAFVGGSNDFVALKDKYFVSEDSFFPALVAVAVRRGFCCSEKLDEVIGRVTAAGLYDQIVAARGFRDFLETNPTAGEIGATTERSLFLDEFEGAILFLVSGCVLSFAVFLAEVAYANLGSVVLRRGKRAKRSKMKMKKRKSGCDEKVRGIYRRAEWLSLAGQPTEVRRNPNRLRFIGSEENMI